MALIHPGFEFQGEVIWGNHYRRKNPSQIVKCDILINNDFACFSVFSFMRSMALPTRRSIHLIGNTAENTVPLSL